MFDEMQAKTGISIPKVSQEKRTAQRADFFGKAEDTFKERQLLQTE